MNCEQAEKLLSQLVFGDLDQEIQAPLDTHLSVCDSCRAKLGDMRVATNLLKEGLEADPAPRLSDDRKKALFDEVFPEVKVQSLFPEESVDPDGLTDAETPLQTEH